MKNPSATTPSIKFQTMRRGHHFMLATVLILQISAIATLPLRSKFQKSHAHFDFFRTICDTAITFLSNYSKTPY
ncbi:MAG: hypothetical protein WCM76_06685 [Bacteroidota bacterium]